MNTTEAVNIKELSEAVDKLVKDISWDFDKHKGIVIEALSYFFMEEFTSEEVRKINNDLRK